jgi:glycogen debranching enzyme
MMNSPEVARSTFAQAANALGCEWLVTNGLGGFVAGTATQANTRRYHGLLVAPQYAGAYAGGPRERDAVYHQGTVWSWLFGPFALDHYRVYINAEHACALLAGLAAHLGEACLGTISDAPHQPRGCFAQAWSVAETRRAWDILTRAQGDAAANDARHARASI